MFGKLHTQSANQRTILNCQPRILEQMVYEKDTHVNFCLTWEFPRMRVRLLAGDDGNSQICKNLFLWRRQKIANDESKGLDRQLSGGVELSGTRGGDDLGKISDRRFCFLNHVRYLVRAKGIQRVKGFLQG